MMYILFRGLLYGVLSVVPGLSGGALAFQTGDYNKCIGIINNKEFNCNNIMFLLLLIIGFIFGTILCSNIVLKLYFKFRIVFKILIFLINIKLLKELINKLNIKSIMLIKIILSTLIVFIIFNTFHLNFYLNSISFYIVSSIIFSFSKVVPGVSGTTILININFYDNLLLFFSNPINQIIIYPLEWLIFILVSIINGYILIKLISNYGEVFNKVVVVILIINIINLII